MRKKLSFVSNDWFGNTFLYTFRLLHSLLQQSSDTPIGSVVIGIILCAILTKSSTLSALSFSHNLPGELSALLRLCYIENPVLTSLFVVCLLCPLLCLKVACSERKPSLSERSSADILLRLSICGLHSNTTQPWWWLQLRWIELTGHFTILQILQLVHEVVFSITLFQNFPDFFIRLLWNRLTAWSRAFHDYPPLHQTRNWAKFMD